MDEKEFVNDCLRPKSEISNEQLMNKYGFKTQRDMWNTLEKLKENEWALDIISKNTKPQNKEVSYSLKNISKILNDSLSLINM